jgi:broad specificity phosphatase PhoE
MTHCRRRLLVCAIVALSLGTSALAQTSVFLVRHAERADAENAGAPVMATDPDLSAAGHSRATALATVLKDAGISAIFVTEYKRTQQTAEPLAKALGVTPIVVKADDTAALVAQIKRSSGNVLVVGHSNTVPDVIKALGVTTPVSIASSEYDNLYVVLPQGAQLIRLHYR